VARLDFGGFWWAAIPQEYWPDVDSIRQTIESKWYPGVGDCRQELVFIGIGMDEIGLYDSLQACLLTDDEMAEGPIEWQAYPDPFPPWDRSIEQLLASLR
jgi:hypothetical protein